MMLFVHAPHAQAKCNEENRQMNPQALRQPLEPNLCLTTVLLAPAQTPPVEQTVCPVSLCLQMACPATMVVQVRFSKRAIMIDLRRKPILGCLKSGWRKD